MARLLIDFLDHRRAVPLGASTRVGRHWSSDVVLPLPQVPLHWLEVRWLGANWAWRALGALDRTVGASAPDTDGWRPLRCSNGRGTRVRFEGVGAVELVDDGPPQLVLHDVQSSERLEQDDALDWVEVVDERAYVLGTDPPRRPLADGEVFAAEGRIWRVLLPDPTQKTVQPALDLAHPRCELDAQIDEARFSVGERGVVLRGEAARVLRVYAIARGEEKGGWLDASDARQRWVELGGNRESPPERIAWERGKIRTRLSVLGVCNVDILFETRRMGPFTEVRLTLPPERVHP